MSRIDPAAGRVVPRRPARAASRTRRAL